MCTFLTNKQTRVFPVYSLPFPKLSSQIKLCEDNHKSPLTILPIFTVSIIQCILHINNRYSFLEYYDDCIFLVLTVLTWNSLANKMKYSFHTFWTPKEL